MNKNPTINDVSNHVAGIVDDIYYYFGRPFYVKWLMNIGFFLENSFLPYQIGRSIWNFGCKLNDRNKRKKEIRDDAAHTAYLIISTVYYYKQIGIPDCDKEFYKKYDEEYINPKF